MSTSNIRSEFKIGVNTLSQKISPVASSTNLVRGVNSFSIDIKSMITFINSKDAGVRGTFSEVSLKWLIKLNYMLIQNRYDDRNRISCEMAHTLIKSGLFNGYLSEEEGVTSFMGYPGFIEDADYIMKESLDVLVDPINYPKPLEPFKFEDILVETLAREHRTLQQSFTKLALFWLYYGKVGRDFLQIQEKLKRVADPRYFSLPTI